MHRIIVILLVFAVCAAGAETRIAGEESVAPHLAPMGPADATALEAAIVALGAPVDSR